MSQQIAMPPKVTVVEVSGTTEAGEKISQDFPVPHQDGVQPGQLLAAALQMFKQLGGLLVDQPDGSMNFYPAIKFAAPMNFVIKNVVLAGADALPPKSGLHLVQ